MLERYAEIAAGAWPKLRPAQISVLYAAALAGDRRNGRGGLSP
jgi:hypothetical protein